VIELPIGSTPVDFAYAIHTEIGHTCIGAKVNGQLVPLSYPLHSGDTCEVFTSKVESAAPTRDWLQFVASTRARTKIRQWFSRERREDMLEAGRDELTKELRRERLPQRILSSEHLKKEAAAANYADAEALLVAIGEHRISARAVAQRIARAFNSGDNEDEQLPASVQHPRSPRARSGKRNVGVHVEGLDDVLVRLSKCCTPVPGDSIIGFVTRGRGVSVHRADCANAVSLSEGQTARLIDVEWDDESVDAVFRANVEVVALDRSRLLRDVANALSDHHVNIVACSTHTGNDRIAKMRFEFEMADPSHLEAVVRTIKTVDAVYDAYRVVPGAAPT
jgi:GTP pyrophosphokinase